SLYFQLLLTQLNSGMLRQGFSSFLAGLITFFANAAAMQAATTNDAPDFKEVYDLVRTHLPGMTESELNRAAVQGLVSNLSPRLSLVTNLPSAKEQPEAPATTKSNV